MRGSRRAASELCKAGYVSSSDLQFVEYVLPHPDLPYEETLIEAREYLADDTLLEELERVYSPLNKREFYGCPVHYKINAASRETAIKLAKLLTKALYTNKRVLSARMTYINDIDCNFYDESLEGLCENFPLLRLNATTTNLTRTALPGIVKENASLSMTLSKSMRRNRCLS